MAPDVIVFDFDNTLFDLRADWDALHAGADRRTVELAAVKGRRLHRPIMDLLDELSMSYCLAIYSRNLTETIKAVLRASLIDGVYVIGRDSGYIKPDVGGLEAIAEYYGSENMLMVGDSWHDKRAAQNYGCECVTVDSPEDLPTKMAGIIWSQPAPR